MSLSRDLHLLSLLHGSSADQVNEILTSPECIALRTALEQQGLINLLTAPKEEIDSAIKFMLSQLETECIEYQDNTFQVNEGINKLLWEIHEIVHNHSDPKLPSVDNVANALIGLGGQDDNFSFTDNVAVLVADQQRLLAYAVNAVGPEKVGPPYPFGRLVILIVFLSDVFRMLDTYLTCRNNPDLSEINLLEESNPMSDAILVELDHDPYDTVEEQLDHILTGVEGTEGFLNGETNLSHSQQYLAGIMFANGMVPPLRDGMEGKIMDTIKSSAQKVWQTLVDALKAIKDFFFGKGDEETQKSTLAIADKNKTDISASDQKGAEVKDAAKNGLVELAQSSDESGEFKGIAETLNTVSDAPGVIEKLKQLMSKKVGEGSKLRDLYNTAEKKMQDLKSLMSKADSVSDDDKEGAAAAKTEIQEGMTEAKESLNEAKKAMGLHKKIMNGLRKALLNITMGIFMLASSSKPAKEATE